MRARADRALKAAGLTRITPHEARHTFGSMLAVAGVDVDERRRRLGHTSSAMMDRFTHGISDSVIAADDRLQM